MAKPGNRGITRVIKAAGYSFKGFRAAWMYESAFRQELALASILIPVAVWLGRTSFETAVLIATLFAVIIVELLNSAIEAVVDRVGDEPHPLSGRAKDLGSAAVFLSISMVILVWAALIYDRFFFG